MPQALEQMWLMKQDHTEVTQPTCDDADATLHKQGRWQGAHWRRACRFSVGVVLTIIVGFSWLTNAPTLSQLAGGLIVIALVVALCEWLFVRGMGVEIEQDAIIFCGPIRRIRIPWEHVQGLVWREAFSLSKTKYLFWKTDTTRPRRVPQDAPIRIPTIASSAASRLPNDRLLGSFLTSPNIRSSAGEEADAFKAIEQAWNAGRKLDESKE